jgi:amino acid adenylation domain-containing protein/non-ribosomal peptide synthase protein (TIGR01720 family)
VRTINLAGEPLTSALADAIYAKTLVERVYDLYGPSEDTTYSTFALRSIGGPATIGRPIANTRTYILDRSLSPVPIGVPGELYIGGAGLARGYLNRPDLTAEKFVPDPFSQMEGERLYRTGDLCRYQSDGNIEFLGRLDHQVKIRGFRIELGEIETVLLDHPSVREAVVVAREEASGEKRLVAYLAGTEGAIDLSLLREHLRSKLPEYMVPSAFMVLESLPLSSNGKIDRKALPAPDASSIIGSQSGEYAAPRTPIEEALCEMWREVLRIERVEQVGIHDNFFELGGHSLLATQVISRVREAFQVDVPLRTLFEHPTVAAFGARVMQARESDQLLATPSIKRLEVRDNIPLSPAQQRLWFIHQLEPDSSAYNLPTAIKLTGSLDDAALEESLAEICRRHEALRTTFETGDGVARQVIRAVPETVLTRIDLSDMLPLDRESETARHMEDWAHRAFDLAQGPLYRFALIRLCGDEQILLMTVHHAVSDGWSQSVLMRELQTLYAAFSSGNPSPLPELPVQYAEFAAWQRDWLDGGELARQLDYWTSRLRGVPALLELPADRPRPAIQSMECGRVQLELPAELARGLKAMGKSHGVTLFMTLLAAFETLLLRYTGQESMVIGTPIANRTHCDIEGLIGFFVNTLALRSDLAGDPTFGELLRRVRESVLDAYANQDVPFERLVDELNPERSLSHSPLYQVMLTLQSAPRLAPTFAGLGAEELMPPGFRGKLDLQLAAGEVGDKLRLSAVYNKSLFDSDRIERMMQHYLMLLEAVVADPSVRLSRLPLLPEPERHQVLVDWNQTDTDYPSDRCIHELFEDQVERRPGAMAVEFDGEQLTYRQLNARANRLAHYLKTQGVGPETLVGLCVERSVEMVVGLLSILKAGGAYVPLDPSYPLERLLGMVEDAQAPLILTQERLGITLGDNHSRVVDIISAEAASRSESEQNPHNRVSGNGLAYTIFTSGSTGRPKGAMNTHDGIRNRLLWMQEAYRLCTDDRVLQKTPFSFDVSVWEFFWPLITGACLVVARPEGHKDPEYLADLISSERITTIHFVPSMLRAFVEAGPLDRCTALRRVICSGEALPADLAAQFVEEHPAELHNLYGPTEAAVDVSYWDCRSRQMSIVPIGRPIANTRLYILDRSMSPVPIGVPGELYIGGAGLARGYLNRPDLTAEKFVPNPFSRTDGERLYRTGDLCRYLPDGNIEFLGRLDHQVKIRGFRIELGEIESVLLDHPSVREAVVLAREAESGEKRLVAYVAGDEGAIDLSLLREHLRSKLPEYMVPSAFMVLDSLPLSSNGKIDRKALPAPDPSRRDVETGYEAPQTAAEEKLVEIWKSALRLDEIGIHDNFFEIGGDSIIGIQIISRANQAGLRLTPRQVFQHQTIHDLAAAAGTHQPLRSEQGAVAGPAPLTPIQRWFLDSDLPELHHFNQSRLLRIDSRVACESAKSAVAALVAHHDALRLRFKRSDNGWEQFNAPDEDIERVFATIDLSTIPESDQAVAITAACSEFQASLDLAAGPLIRVCYFELGNGAQPRLLIAIHHLGVDGVSWRVILPDLETLLDQALRGEAFSLPAKTTSFREWSTKLRDYAQSAAVKMVAEYWLSDGRNLVPELPTDSQARAGAVEQAVRVCLDEPLTNALLQDIPSAYHTQVDDVLLSAVAMALNDWTSERRFLVALEGHGREALFDDVDLSRTVGWFTSMYPVLLELPSSSSRDPGAVIKAVKEQLRAVPSRGVSYGLLRYISEEPDIRERIAAMPEPQITYNYHGRFDRVAGADASLFDLADESAGIVHSQASRIGTQLAVTGRVTDGRLHMMWNYDPALYERGSIERLADRCIAAIQEIIAYCQAGDSGGFTPSDFPDANVSQSDLDRLFATFTKG